MESLSTAFNRVDVANGQPIPEVAHPFYRLKTARLLKVHKRILTLSRPTLSARYGEEEADRIILESAERFRLLIPALPFVGSMLTNCFEYEIVGAVMALALYQAIRAKGEDRERAGELMVRVWEGTFAAMNQRLLRWAGWLYFRRPTWWLLRLFALRSQWRMHPGDFVFSFVPGDGKSFDFGVDFHECAIGKLLDEIGWSEFHEILCAVDFPMSDVMGTGLVRERTLARGDACCTFRLCAGRPVRRGWPLA
ncbi:MAG: L-2-amino-thiazoline-4-carboxylic acid hydrolase [Candidatus Schekmanbacteria bacterium]|nr:L-2-amino-thiazoline-4-carboxylic acid hydrolase [Candidatus Schekmanbacteria bacterium]